MNQSSASPAMSVSAQKPTAAETRLQGAPLVLVRCTWAALVLFTLGLLAFDLPRIPHLLAQFQTPCSNAQCTTGFLSPDALHTLHGLGVSACVFAMFYCVIFGLRPRAILVDH